jgi:hypothetical protein
MVRAADLAQSIRAHGHANVPELHALVLSVAQNVASIALAIDVGQAFDVAQERSSLSSISHASTIPHLNGGIIRSRIKDIRRQLIGKANRIDIVQVAIDMMQDSSRFNVINHDGMGVGTGY